MTSLPGAGGAGYQTIEACTDPTCVTACQLRDVRTVTEDDLPYPNPSLFFPFGLLGFTADCPSVAIRILYHAVDAVPANAVYENFGPNPPGSPANLYYELPGVVFGSDVIGADPAVASARFTLTDGAIGDDTATDGVIISLGGPAITIPTAPAPAMGWTGLLIALSLLLAVGGLGMFRRTKES